MDRIALRLMEDERVARGREARRAELARVRRAKRSNDRAPVGAKDATERGSAE